MITFRPAKRENAPLLIGLAGPSKSGKSLSALRLATGLAGTAPILLVNTEPHGHHYADKFSYSTVDIEPPHRPLKYVEVLQAAQELQPGVLIIDSMTHVHAGLGGMNEWHDELMVEMARGDERKVERMNAPAWSKVKAAENTLINTLLGMRCHVILTFWAKEKIQITKSGEWKDLGWRPVISDRMSFETLFTLLLPPFAKGVPDLAISDLREPFDAMIPKGKALDEELGATLAQWARGTAGAPDTHSHALPSGAPAAGSRPGDYNVVTGTLIGVDGNPIRPPSRTPVDEWEDQIDNVKTAPQRNALWERIKPEWPSFVGKEQKRLIDANARAKERVGG